MNIVVDTAFSSVVTKSVIDEFKSRGWLRSGAATLVASFCVNFLVLLITSLIDAGNAGQDINAHFIKTAASTVMSALYHDARQGIETKKA